MRVNNYNDPVLMSDGSLKTLESIGGGGGGGVPYVNYSSPIVLSDGDYTPDEDIYLLYLCVSKDDVYGIYINDTKVSCSNSGGAAATVVSMFAGIIKKGDKIYASNLHIAKAYPLIK